MNLDENRPKIMHRKFWVGYFGSMVTVTGSLSKSPDTRDTGTGYACV